MMKEVKSIIGEDYEQDYGVADYKNKTVLDIGADWGSTAYYFLLKGAKRVIAVEGDEHRVEKLLNNIAGDDRVIPLSIWIKNKTDYETLIKTYKPDIIKADCEGCEVYLERVENEILRLCNEYVIETHDLYPFCIKRTFQPRMCLRLKDKFQKAGFKLITCNRPSSEFIVKKYKDRLRICYWRI